MDNQRESRASDPHAVPPAPGDIRVGACGYDYPGWAGSVYPAGVTGDAALTCYARDLGLGVVELPHTYLRMPEPEEMERLRALAPPGFLFAPKLPETLVSRVRDPQGGHVRDEAAVERFRAGIAPLLDGGALACAVAQFPQKFARGKDSEDHLRWLARALAPVPLAVELRHESWIAHSVFERLREWEVTWIAVDSPPRPNMAPFTPWVTAPLAYVRLLGRSQGWDKGPSAARYEYDYSDLELRQALDTLMGMGRQARRLIVTFANYPHGHAVKNALRLRELLGLAPAR